MLDNTQKNNSKKYEFSICIIILCFINLLSFTHPFNLYTSLHTFSQKIYTVGSDGIYLFDDELNQISKMKTFSNEKLSGDFLYILLRQYEQGDGYVFIRIKENIYIYLEEKLICESTLDDYSETPYDIILNNYEKISDSNYIFYYIIVVVNTSNKIILEQRKLICSNSTNQNIIIKQSSTIKNSQNQEGKCKAQIVTCQTLYSKNLQKNVITCFCHHSYPYNLFSFSLTLDENFTQIKSFNGNDDLSIYTLSSVASVDKTKILVCYLNDNKENCYIYDLDTNQISNEILIFNNCVPDFTQKDIRINYFNETNEFLLSCRRKNSTSYLILDSNFNIKKINDINENCYSEYQTKESGCIYYSGDFLTYFNNDKKYYGITSCYKGLGDIFEKQVLTPTCSGTINRTINESNFFNNTNTTNNNTSESSDKSEKNNKNNSDPFYIIFDPMLEKNVIIGRTNETKENIINDLEKVMSIIEIGKNYEIKGKDYEIKIHPTDNIVYDNSTYVDFTECKKILREKYHMPDEEILTMLQIEIVSNNENSLINNLEYAVYD